MTSPCSALLSFDFDGTLVDKFREPSFEPELGELLSVLQRTGAAWVIDTGRSLAHTLEGILEHNIPEPPDFIIAREHQIYRRNEDSSWSDLGEWNSACRARHETFFESHRPFLAQVKALIEEAQHGWWIADPSDPAGLITHTETKMAEVVAFIEKLRLDWPELGFHRNSVYLRFTHRDFDKGTALRELGRHLGLGPEHIFAAGDNYNDVPMFDPQVARMVCCPSNALPEIKDQIRTLGGYVARGTASRGMIEGLQHYFPAARAHVLSALTPSRA